MFGELNQSVRVDMFDIYWFIRSVLNTASDFVVLNKLLPFLYHFTGNEHYLASLFKYLLKQLIGSSFLGSAIARQRLISLTSVFFLQEI